MTPTMASLLASSHIDALLVSDSTNIRYLSGCAISAGRVLVTKKFVTLYVDARYFERAQKKAKKSVRIRSYSDLQADLKPLKRLGIEADSVTLAQFSRWQKSMKNKKLVHTFDFIEGLRREKREYEIRSIQRACSITKKILLRIPALLITGHSERDLAWKIACLAHDLGADDLAFPSIVGFGSNTSIPHHEPTQRKLKKSDLVQIDLGVKVDGYCSDFSRVFFLAPLTPEQKRVYGALQKAKKSAESILKAGVTNHALDAAARAILKKEHLDEYFIHALGHGVGLDIHEGMTLSARAPITTVKKNEVITLEPGVYFPGKWGMRVEDTYIVH